SERRLRRESLGPPGPRLDELLRALHSQDDLLYALARRHRKHAGLRRLALATALLHKGRATEASRDAARGPGGGDQESLRRPGTPRAWPSPDEMTEAVRRALPPDGALIELIEYEERT